MEIPEYNKLDLENDTLDVLEAKIKAIRKQREKLFEEEKKIQEVANEKFGKPLGEWP
jgi:chaperonin cofactor prefoldin